MKLKDEYSLIVTFPTGGVLVRANEEFILESAFVKGAYLERSSALSSFKRAQIPLLKEAKKQLSYYFEGKCKDLCLPLDMSIGTDFQKRVSIYLLWPSTK